MKTKSKYPTKFKSIVKDAVKDFRWMLGLQVFEVPIMYMEQDKELDNDEFGQKKVAASIDVDRRYLKGTLRIYPMLMEGWKDKTYDKKYIRGVIAHEIGHIATAHIYALATSVYKDEGETKDAWESLTEIVGKLLVDAFEYRK